MFSRALHCVSAGLIIFCIVLLLAGCGGGSGSGHSSTVGSVPVVVTAARASGKVVLPTGFPLASTSLTVVSGVDAVPLKADGTFSIRSGGPGQALVVLQNPAGKALLLGFADNAASASPQAGGKGEISPSQTAVALLFYTFGLFTLPSDQWQHARDVIAQLPQTAQLASTITTRMAFDPMALGDGDVQIITAITQARQSIQPGSRAVSNIASRGQATRQQGPAITTVTVSRAAGDPAVLIEPSPGEQQSGVNINPSPDGMGIVLVNHFRRRAAAFIYETATIDSQGIRTDLDKPIPVMFPDATLLGALFSPGVTQPVPFMEVAPANALNGTFGSLTDVIPALTGAISQPNKPITDGAWVAKSAGPITLTPDGGAAKTIYKVVLVGPSFSQKNNVMTSFLATDPQFHLTSFAPQWQKVVTDLSKEEIVLDIIFPLVSSIVLTSDFEEKLETVSSTGIIGSGNLKDDVGIFTDFLALVGSSPDFAATLASINNGNFTAAVQNFVQALADSGEVRDRVTKWMLKRVTIDYPPDVFGAPKIVADQFKKQLESFSEAASVADLLLALTDSTRIGHDSVASLPVESWDITVLPGKVGLSPVTASVDTNHSTVPLTVTIQGTNDLSLFRFAWSTTGKQGSLTSSGAGNKPLPTGPIADQNVVYVADLKKLQIGQSDTVTVQVFQAADLKTPIGMASSTITGRSSTDTCGPLPPPTVSSGPGSVVLSLDRETYHTGDILTATIHVRGGEPKAKFWNISFINISFVSGGPTGFPTLLTVDGLPARPDSLQRAQGNLSPGSDETHIVTYTVHTLTDGSVSPPAQVTKCGAGLIVGTFSNLDGSGGVGSAITSFNLAP